MDQAESPTHSADYACSNDQEQERNMCALPTDDIGRCDDNEVEFRVRVIDPSSTTAGGVGPWSPWSRYVTQLGSGLTGAADAAVAAAVRDTIMAELVAITTLTKRIYTSEGALFRTIESEFRTIGDGRKAGGDVTARQKLADEATEATASRLLFEALREIAAFAETLEKRPGAIAERQRRLTAQIVQYRRDRGWDPNGPGISRPLNRTVDS